MVYVDGKVLSLFAQHVMEKLIMLGSDLLADFKDKPMNRTSTNMDIIQHILQRFDEDVASKLQADSPAWELFLTALGMPHSVDDGTSPQLLALEQITREAFAMLPEAGLQCGLVTMLVDIFIATNSADVARKVQKTIKQVCHVLI